MTAAVEVTFPMRTASVESAATVNVAVTPAMEALSAAESVPAAKAPASVEVTPSMPSTFPMELAMASEPVAATEFIAIAKPVAAVAAVVASSVVAAEPWPRSKKHSAAEIFGAVIAVRSTSVWVRPIVAVSAGRGRPDVRRSWTTNAELDRNLRVSVRRVAREQDNKSNHQRIL
jgi:hypothetical protein